MGKRKEYNKMTTVKCTININKQYKEQLEALVKQKEIISLNEGINIAVKTFIKAKQKDLYAKQMAEAAHDADFIERTLTAQREFDKIDNEWFS